MAESGFSASEDHPAPARRDRGSTFIEILVAVVLLGTVIVATLASLQATILGTAIERDHAKAHQWLQSASGAIRETDYVPCDDVGTFATGQDHMISDYTDAIRGGTVLPPPGWAAGQIEVLAPIEVWDGNNYLGPAETSDPDDCFHDAGFALQLITIQVRDVEGRIVEDVQVVKDDG